VCKTKANSWTTWWTHAPHTNRACYSCVHCHKICRTYHHANILYRCGCCYRCLLKCNGLKRRLWALRETEINAVLSMVIIHWGCIFMNVLALMRRLVFHTTRWSQRALFVQTVVQSLCYVTITIIFSIYPCLMALGRTLICVWSGTYIEHQTVPQPQHTLIISTT
jgi:hypothetical protein